MKIFLTFKYLWIAVYVMASLELDKNTFFIFWHACTICNYNSSFDDNLGWGCTPSIFGQCVFNLKQYSAY